MRGRERLAVDGSGRILVYRSGVYLDGAQQLTHLVAELLGDLYRQMHMRSLVEVLEAGLHHDGLVVGDTAGDGLVNVANGLLDLFTGVLIEHTADHLSMVQLPIRWEPTATCSLFDRWLTRTADGRGDDLLEALSLVLDVRGERQRKAVFIIGPARSGKSTMVRIIEAIVGPQARSAVTLHEMSADKFAGADLYGKLLNTGSELSARTSMTCRSSRR